ncbi:hypothetical protein [Aquabacterium humicola]|uniref:hypothetical protein n=1 Tax=Aquabacterium humicola TaxID=3237377 RepID=UPI002543E026|nr:hypothetical protein [Rubrivivax pictus]
MPALAGTPLTLDFMAALACQETGEVWPTLRKNGMTVPQVLALCVGDTLDSDKGRKAFPRTKADLVAAPQGDRMFEIARQALVDMAKSIPAYAGAAARPNKFCHGFGLFQRDLQFFQVDPGFFLDRTYETLEGTLAEALKELKRCLKKLGFDTRPSLDDLELAAVGIVYNTGGFKPEKGLKQGHHNGSQFYGEALFDFLRLAHTVAAPGASPEVPPPANGEAAVLPPSIVTSAGAAMCVRVAEGMLRLRSEPRISEPSQANVIGHLPDGHPVRVLGAPTTRRFVEVETSLNGALLHGFASQKFLEPVADASGAIEVLVPITKPATAGIKAVHAPTRPGVIARRKTIATALSLNEPNQPARSGATADELRASIARVIEWLDVENPMHARYQPRDGLTFCNIYAHDFCHLAGAYLPRVWWTDKALVALAKGETVEPRLGATIGEVVANELFAWLRDFGLEFGWRQTGTLTKLQTEVNQGAIGVIVARRKEGKRPGHIAMVVPETDSDTAKRDGSGDVTAPLQSQAGASNFRRGTGRKNWWLGEEFAEFAFWLHA